VAVFTRSLDEITPRVPEVVATVRALPVREIVLDGEAIALDVAGRPRPFQETSSRAATRGARRKVAAELAAELTGDPPVDPTGDPTAEPTGDPTVDPTADPIDRSGGDALGAGDATVGGGVAGGGTVLTPYFFDLLHLDGEDLLDAPGQDRWATLAKAVPSPLLVGRSVVDSVSETERAFAAAIDAGHEGIVVKSLAAPYDVGRRGGAWVKVKPRHTLDLVVLAVEWGHGRRKGWLSNLHLGARDPATGGFVMLGKTFKGLTDELLRWQTERFQELAIERGDWVVRVRPEQVVEIAFDGVQTSPRYPGGVALRFARVIRYRHDKTAAEADTIEMVRAIHLGRGPQSAGDPQSAATERT
jgi:DNA ligase-1